MHKSLAGEERIDYDSALGSMPMRPHRVLCVSYDVALLTTRRLLLERDGYTVTASASFKAASEQCENRQFDLFILGQSIPADEKAELMKIFRAHCPAPILSLQTPDEEKVPDADYYSLSPSPEEWLQQVATILGASEGIGASPSGPAPATKLPPAAVSTKARKPPQSA